MSVDRLLLWGIVAHLVADWLFQNDWIAANKQDLNHPAAWCHGCAHFLALALVFSPGVAAAVALLHVAVDTRKPLGLWKKLLSYDESGPCALHVAIWRDQVTHITIIAITALLCGVH